MKQVHQTPLRDLSHKDAIVLIVQRTADHIQHALCNSYLVNAIRYRNHVKILVETKDDPLTEDVIDAVVSSAPDVIFNGVNYAVNCGPDQFEVYGSTLETRGSQDQDFPDPGDHVLAVEAVHSNSSGTTTVLVRSY